MIVDYRIYLSFYAFATLAWLFTPILMEVCSPRFVARWMAGVAGIVGIGGLFNFLDWLWA